MARDITELRARLEFKLEALKKARQAYIDLLDGNAQSYTIGSRSLTRLDLDKLKAHIKALENEVDELEAEIAGGKARKSVGVIPMDW